VPLPSFTNAFGCYFHSDYLAYFRQVRRKLESLTRERVTRLIVPGAGPRSQYSYKTAGFPGDQDRLLPASRDYDLRERVDDSINFNKGNFDPDDPAPMTSITGLQVRALPGAEQVWEPIDGRFP
jgi:hypothetical protein